MLEFWVFKKKEPPALIASVDGSGALRIPAQQPGAGLQPTRAPSPVTPAGAQPADSPSP